MKSGDRKESAKKNAYTEVTLEIEIEGLLGLLTGLVPSKWNTWARYKEVDHKRNLDCSNYRRCLDLSEERGMTDFACWNCPQYQYGKKLKLNKDVFLERI